MKKFLFFFPILLCLNLAHGQNFAFFQKNTDEGIALRWFPKNFNVWNSHLTSGYFIERAENSGNYQRISISPVLLDLPVNSSAGELSSQIIKYQDSLDVVRSTPSGQRLLSGIYRAYLNGIAATPEGIQKSGLYYLDKTAQPGKSYRYRLLSKNGEQLAESNIMVTDQNKLPDLNLQGKEYVAELSWQHSIATSDIQAYKLERSVDGITYQDHPYFWQFPTAPFFTKTDDTITTFLLQDTVPVLNTTYFYRLIGVTAFGEIQTGKVIRFQARDQTPPERPKNFTAMAAENTAAVNINWEKNDDAGDLMGYNLYRSSFPDSAYFLLNNQLIPPEQSSYVDQDIVQTGTYYYKIVAIDKTRNERSSFRRSVVFPDKTPPAVPSGLRLTISKDGSVELDWQPNKEADFRGYQLAIARFADDEFVPVTALPIQTTSFRDTLALNFINREIYYSIAALDQHGNLSAYSAPVMGLIPDTIIPIRPLLEKPTSKGDTLTLTWQPSGDEDLAYVEIYTRKISASEWNKPLISKSLQQFQSVRTDTLFDDWVYAIRTVDESGNKSPFSNERVLKAIDYSSVIPDPEQLNYRLLDNTQLELSWTYPKTKAPVSFLVFRLAAGSKAPVLDARTQKKKIQIKTSPTGTSDNFFIIAQDENGHYSNPSKEVSVSY